MRTELQWFKSSYSTSEGGQCLEVAHEPAPHDVQSAVHVRDSKNPTGPVLTLAPTAWAAFAATASR
ncbi:DUF397 domain-containing protein [Streptomyces sp. NPDC049954]|uniref:DUF397 domain-containing protein n=1 Tax=Streptomyces sp. NPDC049954 TaxID=3155779 RepID=UPI003432DAD8